MTGEKVRGQRVGARCDNAGGAGGCLEKKSPTMKKAAGALWLDNVSRMDGVARLFGPSSNVR